MEEDMVVTPALAVLIALFFLASGPQSARLQKSERAGKMTIDLTTLGQPGQRVTFTEAAQLKLLPREVLETFKGDIVNPGEDFQLTDVVGEKVLPSRRLIVAGVSDHYCLVHYERGGIAHGWLIALFKWSKGKAERVWVSNLPPKSLNFAGLKAMVESGKLRDQPSLAY